jgi:phosphoadenosine phosphosulfate reductase
MNEQLLNGFEQSQQDMINIALAMPLGVKIEKAITLLKEYEQKAKEFDDDGFYCCDSFGKDSGVIVHLCKLSGVKYKSHHNLTTIDPPELIWFGKKNRPETVVHIPKINLINRMIEKGNPPTRKRRWCCAEYKERDPKEICKIIGVRIEESVRRAGLWRIINQNRNGGIIIAPIAYWTEKDVWDFHKLYNLPYCSLYDEGFHRLGCIGCPLAGTQGQKKEFIRWPNYERLWKNGFKKMWKFWLGKKGTRSKEERFWYKFKNSDEVFEWWISGVAGDTNHSQCIFEEMMSNT